jgi:hypothetical protein
MVVGNLVFFCGVVWSELHLYCGTEMNLWLSLFVGGAVTAVSVAIVVYTIIQEWRPNKRVATLGIEQRKMLPCKASLSEYDALFAYSWINWADRSVVPVNPPWMLEVKPHWVIAHEMVQPMSSLVAVKDLPDVNQMTPIASVPSLNRVAEMLLMSVTPKRLSYSG